MFQVILFAAHAVVDALYSGRNSATHPNFDTVKQYLRKLSHKVIAKSHQLIKIKIYKLAATQQYFVLSVEFNLF